MHKELIQNIQTSYLHKNKR